MRTVENAALSANAPSSADLDATRSESGQILRHFADMAGASEIAIFADDDQQPLASTAASPDWEALGLLGAPALFGWHLCPRNGASDALAPCHALQTNLSRRGGRALKAAFLFHEEVDQEQTEQSITQVRPLLSSYFQLVIERNALRSEVDSLRVALDRLDLGAFILDRKLRLVFANQRGEAFLAAPDGLRRSGGSIAATGVADALRLHVAISHVRDNGLAVPAHVTLTLSRAQKKRPLMLAVLAGHCGRGEDETFVILYVLDPDDDLRPLIGAACNLYQLSVMEGAVVAELIAGRSLNEVAASLRLKLNTVRSYLKQIFVKMGVNRQSELARVVLTSIIRIAAPKSLKRL